MSFNSYAFILGFMPVTIVVYYALRRNHTAGRIWLLAVSLAFYAFNGIMFLPFGVAEVIVNYLFGRGMIRYEKHKKKIFIAAVAVNVITLIVFKYTGFIFSMINVFLHMDLNLPQIPMPAGISFITFQQIAYLADVYNDEKAGEHSLLDFGIFTLFFPKVLSGPIITRDQFFPLLNKERSEKDYRHIASGIILFTIGLVKKVIIADPLAAGVDYAYANPDSINATTMLLAGMLYTLQIYFDFSGYSDMAIGLARMIGLDLPVNFESPYQANDISEFWDRWHISLTRFLTKYIYIPLGGSRNGRVRTYINIIIVFIISGIWHGASITFVLWGLFHGILMLVHRLVGDKIKLPKIVGRILTLALVNAGWILFRSGDLSGLIETAHVYLRGGWGIPDINVCSVIYPRVISIFMKDASGVVPAIIYTAVLCLITQIPVNSKQISEKIRLNPLVSVCVVCAAVLCLISLSGVTHFIYAYF